MSKAEIVRRLRAALKVAGLETDVRRREHFLRAAVKELANELEGEDLEPALRASLK